MMVDIGNVLNNIMKAKECSPVYAFFLLAEDTKEGDTDGICNLQPEPKKETRGRLRDKSNI